MRRAAILAPIVLLLAGCGGRQVATHPPAAEVAGQSIQWSDISHYEQYALAFYAQANSVSGASAHRSCRPSSKDPICSRLERQVLRRLLEEAVVIAYARSRHISLSRNDQALAQHEVAALSASAGPTAGLLARRRVDRPFVGTLLRNELLIQKVEDSVTLRRASSGRSYHLLTVSIPIDPLSGTAGAYKAALELATFGEPIPPTAAMHISWKAAFRLSPAITNALLAAKKGEYVGPFRQQDRYLVLEMLGKGVHRYGAPARTAMQTLYFREWISKRLSSAHARCYNAAGASTSCPSSEMNGL